MSEEQELKNFSNLIFQGTLREAVRFITDRQGGGVMSPNEEAVKPKDKTVFEVLCDKHPEQKSQKQMISLFVKTSHHSLMLT